MPKKSHKNFKVAKFFHVALYYFIQVLYFSWILDANVILLFKSTHLFLRHTKNGLKRGLLGHSNCRIIRYQNSHNIRSFVTWKVFSSNKLFWDWVSIGRTYICKRLPWLRMLTTMHGFISQVCIRGCRDPPPPTPPLIFVIYNTPPSSHFSILFKSPWMLIYGHLYLDRSAHCIIHISPFRFLLVLCSMNWLFNCLFTRDHEITISRMQVPRTNP